MKYLPLHDFETVTSALNFDTADLHVIGGCDLHTIKAVGDDKKLYKRIEDSLESNYRSYMELSKSLSPPEREALAVSLSRSMPFGPPALSSSRRKYAYLISTLNASYPDYDFSNTLRTTDFRKMRSYHSVRALIDRTLYNLRPHYSSAFLYKREADLEPAGCRTPGGSEAWSPLMWSYIDEHMTLSDCEAYQWLPEDDPFEGDEGSLWSYHFFFYNKDRKRVTYLYLRAMSILSHSPTLLASKRKNRGMGSVDLDMDAGARKRAKFWFGERANALGLRDDADEDDNDGYIERVPDEDDEYDERPESDVRSPGYPFIVISDDEDDYDDTSEARERRKADVRAMSDELAESMEM